MNLKTFVSRKYFNEIFQWWQKPVRIDWHAVCIPELLPIHKQIWVWFVALWVLFIVVEMRDKTLPIMN